MHAPYKLRSCSYPFPYSHWSLRSSKKTPGPYSCPYISSLKLRYALGLNYAISISLSPSQRTAANAKLCNELREHILTLHNQLIQPLVGKREEDIPHGTLTALIDFTGYVALIVSFGSGLLINGHRRIGRGLQHPRLSKYRRVSRALLAKDIEGDLRMVMDLIRLDTESYLVRLARGGELTVYSILFICCRLEGTFAWNSQSSVSRIARAS